MQRLHDKVPTRPEKRRHGSEQRFHHLVSKKRKVAESDIKVAFHRSVQDAFVRRDDELTAPSPSGLIDEGWDRINPNRTGHPGCKLTDKPSLTATKIKDRVRRTAHHGINDRLIGDQDAALDLTISYSGSPRRRILAPGVDDFPIPFRSHQGLRLRATTVGCKQRSSDREANGSIRSNWLTAGLGARHLQEEWSAQPSEAGSQSYSGTSGSTSVAS